MTDEQLVRAAAGGDPDAFATIAGPRPNRLFATASLILRDRGRAEDAVQNALVRAWRDLRTLRDPGRLDAWLRRLVVNACHDQSRRQRRHGPTSGRPTATRTSHRSAPHRRGPGRVRRRVWRQVEPSNARCGVLTRDEAAAIVDALARLDVQRAEQRGHGSRHGRFTGLGGGKRGRRPVPDTADAGRVPGVRGAAVSRRQGGASVSVRAASAPRRRPAPRRRRRSGSWLASAA